jgi:hypothetical protein
LALGVTSALADNAVDVTLGLEEAAASPHRVTATNDLRSVIEGNGAAQTHNQEKIVQWPRRRDSLQSGLLEIGILSYRLFPTAL